LTLLVSNQFVEIKQSVFKKFEKENLFQVSCSDVVERVQVGWLVLIGIWNFSELAPSFYADDEYLVVEDTSSFWSSLISFDFETVLAALPTPYTIFSIHLA
jgi:hypothetical protein